jgi:hypothetical protein
MNQKIVPHTILLIGLVLLTSCTTNATVETNAETVVSTAAEIADFDLPAGYYTDFSTSLMGYTIASFRPDDEHSHLYFIQFEKEVDGENLAQMLDKLLPGTSDPQTRMTVIETRPIILRGQEVTLVTSEGISSDGETYRQMTVAFQGKGGPALLVLSEPASRWDQETVDTFLASIQ